MSVLLQKADKEGGHFDKVIEEIDKMVETLREEEATDLKNKEECEGERMEKTKEARKLSLKIDDATEEIARQLSLSKRRKRLRSSRLISRRLRESVKMRRWSMRR